MPETATEPPAADEAERPEAYATGGGDRMVFHTPGEPAEWIESDVVETPPDAGAEDEDWQIVRDHLEEDWDR